MLGVCLGHQALAAAFGGNVVRGQPVHGKTASVDHDGRTVYRGLDSPFEVGRYHSLVVDPDLPDTLQVSARAGDVIMGLRHSELPAEGVQFHPESVLTGEGKRLLRNFLRCLSRSSPTPSTACPTASDLSADEAAAVLREIMEGRASEVQTAAFLIALRAKGETVAEVAGLARTMRELAVPVAVDGDIVDTAGTGGGRSTFNVSTTAAFVAAGAGCRVAKHGGRSNTSQCGSADVLEALGARIDPPPEEVAACVEEVGFGFMFAPAHHGAMKHVAPVRRELGVRTAFNLLGPLTNPAGARRQVIGVSEPRFLDTVAGALGELGTERALVVSSEDGFDEFSASGETHVVEVEAGSLRSYSVTPEHVGLERVANGAVGAGTPEENAAVLRSVLEGARGTERSLTVLNAGAAIYAAGRAAGPRGRRSPGRGVDRQRLRRGPCWGVSSSARGGRREHPARGAGGGDAALGGASQGRGSPRRAGAAGDRAR